MSHRTGRHRPHDRRCEPPEPGDADLVLATATTTTTTTTTGCDLNDPWGPNPSPDVAADVSWGAADPWSAFHAISDAYLCAGEDDWYRFDVAGLRYTTHFVYIRALVEDAGLCGAACDEPVLMPGPEHALTVEVYRGDTDALLTAQTDDDGVLMLGGFGDDYAHTLLIRVYSPTASAGFPYRLSVNIRNYEGEDECEC